MPWLVQMAPGSAFESSDRSGKWCVHRDSHSVDAAWRLICALVANGVLPAAKVSTQQAVAAGQHAKHVLCVYTPDWQDTREVQRVREVLRAAGFEERLGYKTDADTAAGVERFVYEA